MAEVYTCSIAENEMNSDSSIPRATMNKLISVLFCLGILLNPIESNACSILYYKNIAVGEIYAVNSEDFFLDVDAYIQIEPKSKKKFARLWYGWDKFAQGGINE